jgi:hypothetical protein
MNPGSKITKFTTSTPATAAVTVSNGTFTMHGGEFTGNTNNGTPPTTTQLPVVADLNITGANAVVNLDGGTIGSVLSAITGSTFQMRGTASITNLYLKGATTTTPKVMLPGSLSASGGVAYLHLYANLEKNPNPGNGVITAWKGKQIILNSGNYVVTAADISKFHLGNFISKDSSDNTIGIGTNNSSGWKDGATKGYKISDDTNDRGVLVVVP